MDYEPSTQLALETGSGHGGQDSNSHAGEQQRRENTVEMLDGGIKAPSSGDATAVSVTGSDTTLVSNSGSGTNASNSSTISSSPALPPRSADGRTAQIGRKPTSTPPSYDEQYQMVTEEMRGELKAGDAGFLISMRWLSKVIAKTTDGAKAHKVDKESLEAEVGALDNRDLVPEGM